MIDFLFIEGSWTMPDSHHILSLLILNKISVIVTHSSILAWEIPWTNEPEGLQSMGLQESDVI